MTPLFLPIFAQAAADAASGASVLTIGAGAIAALGGAVAAVIAAYRKGLKERASMTLEPPVPEVPVTMTRKFSPPTFYQHTALEKRVSKVEQSVDDLRREQAHQFQTLLQAGEARADRLLDKLDGVARGIHGRIDAMLKDQPHE
jgi:hypothetical protein